MATFKTYFNVGEHICGHDGEHEGGKHDGKHMSGHDAFISEEYINSSMDILVFLNKKKKSKIKMASSTSIRISQIIILLLFIIFLSYWMALLWNYWKNIPVRHVLWLFFLLALIVFYNIIVQYFSIWPTLSSEPFFFEVSPERKKCLLEQVLPVEHRTKGCCSKGTVGGYPPNYKEWIAPNDTEEWHRVDGVVKDPEYPSVKTQIPPTDICPMSNPFLQNHRNSKQANLIF